MRLRRKNTDEDLVGETGEAPETDEDTDLGATGTAGPIDIEDLDPEQVYIDLGSMLIPADSGLELRLQVEEQSGNVIAVLLVGEEGILEARAFASSRGGDLWADARREIAADAVTRGGTATEQDGPFGPELYCELPMIDEEGTPFAGPDGEPMIQPSRVVGHNGPRWFMRASIVGVPAQDAESAAVFEETFRSIAVRRGAEAMAPGEPLPLRLPPEARQVDEDGDPVPSLDD
jgi:hypothetical protein